MRFRIRFADQLVGAFLLLALGFLIVTIILLGVNQRWFSKSIEFTSRFDSASGLNRGMPITLKGFEIGKLTGVTLTDDNAVDITFEIYEEYYSRIRVNSVLQLASSPLGLGGGGLVFHPGKSEEVVAPGSFIPPLDSAEGKRLVKAKLVSLPAGEDVMSGLLAGADAVLSDVPGLMVELGSALRSLTVLLDSADGVLTGEVQGPVGETFTRVNTALDETMSRVNSLLETLEEISTNLERTSAALAEPDVFVASLSEKLIRPDSSLATLLDDRRELYGRLLTMLDTIQKTLDETQSFSAYLSTTKPQILGLLEETRTTLTQGKDVLEGVRNNPLIRGGITEKPQQNAPYRSFRDEDF